MTAWTDAIDGQTAAIDAKTTSLNSQRASLVTLQDTASSVYFAELARTISMIDAQKAALATWRGVLVNARALGYLPDSNTKWYETWNA
jgi:hypothetical protein